MPQVIVTKNVSERAICLEYLRDMGYEHVGLIWDYSTDPNVVVHDDKTIQTAAKHCIFSGGYSQITVSQFLTENTIIK